MMNLPKCLLAASTALTVLASVASAKIEREVERTFQVQPGVHVNLSTLGGNITVTSTTDAEVKIVAKEHIRTNSDAEADELLKKLNLTFEQKGDTVSATAEYQSSMGFHFGSWPPVEVEFEVRVPVSASVDLKTSGGDEIVGDLLGKVYARTSGGDIKLGRIVGDINASTSGGNVSIEEGQTTVKASTSGGNITAKHLVGPSDLKTSGGDIKIESVENAIDARTSGGDIKANFDGVLRGDSKLDTSGGQVKATVGKTMAFHLNADTSGGEVDASGLTITIDRGGVGKSSLAGSVNGGGPDLRLHTSGGDIDVETR
jgi:DUF4097 and DUF4098 domain-containing protein YvlB